MMIKVALLILMVCGFLFNGHISAEENRPLIERVDNPRVRIVKKSGQQDKKKEKKAKKKKFKKKASSKKKAPKA